MPGVSAPKGLLDGKVFAGQSNEKHKRTFKDDELSFLEGKFNSALYSQKGFNEVFYTASTENNEIYFEAETINPKGGKIKWRGTVRGDSIKVNFHLSRKGWLSNTEKDFLFSGTLKK
jgi:hypothetical protein